MLVFHKIRNNNLWSVVRIIRDPDSVGDPFLEMREKGC
jgi:hypothetical protein